MPGTDSPVGSSNVTDDDYIACAEDAVCDQLKSPSSARFSSGEVEEIDDYGRILISITVDSENSFGAMIRNYAVVVIQKYNPEKKSYIYNPSYGVQLYSDSAMTDTAIEMVKSLNDWNEPLADEIQ